MSRNLGQTECDRCGSNRIILEESPRYITPDEAGPYYEEFRELQVSNAYCGYCYTKYLAWVKMPERTRPDQHLTEEKGFFDLSYRSTFNDEPGNDDIGDGLPKVPSTKVSVLGLRRVEVNWPLREERFEGFFHCWGEESGQNPETDETERDTVAIIEKEDGQVQPVPPGTVKFLD